MIVMSFVHSIQCPSCGANNDIRNPAIQQITCPYCQSLILLDENDAKLTGKKSRLIPSLAGLAVGVEGKYNNQSFTVIGRVQYKWIEGSDSGLWDEWYLEQEGGENVWLSEDSGELRLEKDVASGKQYKEASINVGHVFQAEGSVFSIREKRKARCVGAEGQLPFRVEPDEEYMFADGIDFSGRYTATIEFDLEEEASLYIGLPVSEEDLLYNRVETEIEAKNVATMQCPNCGSALNPRGKTEDIVNIVCESCSSRIKVDEGTAVAVGMMKAELAEEFLIPVGSEGELNNIKWLVAGRILYRWEEMDDGEIESGYNHEYLLYNEKKGYRWLAYDDGSWSMAKVSYEAPETSLFDVPDNGNITLPSRTYSKHEEGELELVYVDGSLPWEAHVGSTVQYAEARGHGLIFTEERTGSETTGEVEFYISHRLKTTTVYHAFGLKKPKGRKPIKTRKFRGSTWISVAAGIVLTYIAISAATTEELILDEQESLRTKKEILSTPFKIERSGETIRVRLNTDLSNNWGQYGLALYRADEKAILADDDFGLEEYHGYEDGEYWSEGNSGKSIRWRIQDPGIYRLFITQMEAGISNTQITYQVYRNSMDSFWLWFIALAWFVLPTVRFFSIFND